MTGAELARRLRKRISVHIGIARGSPCRFSVGERTAYLSPNVYDGTTHEAHAIAAHECAHAAQLGQMGGGWLVLLSRIEPVNLWLEWRCWKVAMLLLADELHPDFTKLAAWEDTRRACLLTDVRRALAYVGGVAVVVGLACWLRATA